MRFRLVSLGIFLYSVISRPLQLHDQVIRVRAENMQKRNVLDSIIHDPFLELDIWKDDWSEIDIRVTGSNLPTFKDRLKDFEYIVIIDDLQALVEAEQIDYARKKKRNILTAQDLFASYQDADTLIEFLDNIPGAQPINLGATYEGNQIRGIKFGRGSKNVVINGGIHAREWISPAVTAFTANYLLGSDSEAVDMRSKFTFHIIPVLNPDGYAYTRDLDGDRFWRKNREPNLNNVNCTGTDINRNFEYMWGNDDKECMEGYAGASPFSTKEAEALDNYIRNLDNVVAYFDLHSYSQLWLIPYGWTTDPSPDEYDQISASKAAVEAIMGVHGTNFVAQQSSRLYITTGTANDHFYGLRKIKYSVAVELRDGGNYGFLLPAEQIVPSGEEFTAGLIAFLDYHFDELDLKKEEELNRIHYGNSDSERASTSMSKTTLVAKNKSTTDTESNLSASVREDSIEEIKELGRKRTGSSKYHQKYEPVSMATRINLDKNTRDKINKMKRILLHTKMQQEPLELKKYCRVRLAKEQKSKIPVARWNPSTVYRPDPLHSKSPKKNKDVGKIQDPIEQEIKPYILNLVPYITPLSVNANSPAQPFRDRFQLEYSNAYLEIAKSIPKIKYKPLNLTTE
ncbi:Carboxypeptidase A5 [Boothiomyces sp. JEL0866]|nr:Carboxypeptidase A5 [Boothiomyces sp. JEL0866]